MESWFSAQIGKWYLKNKRDLPWRHTTNPYHIWLSEIILQQTQVAQGLAYYNRFILKYPTVKDLAAAKEDEVLKLWQGLGYYSRARNLLFTANVVVQKHKGLFPANHAQIKELKGIGDYTAAAIASFAFNLPHAVVDGNVYRLLSRLFGIKTPIDSTQGKKIFSELAQNLLNRKNPALHNQAIMEFGSQFCKPTRPDCKHCIFNNKCEAYKNGWAEGLPLKTKKTKVKKRYFNYVLIIDQNNNVLLNRRGQSDIWQGLYEFVLFENSQPVLPADLYQSTELLKVCGREFDVLHVSKTFKHILSHQQLMAVFHVIRVKKFVLKKGLFKTGINELI